MTTRARLRTLTGALSAGLFALTMAIQGPAQASVSATPTKTVGLSGPAVYDLTVLDSGRVILGGKFTAIGPAARSNLGAILPTGKADLAFAPTTNGEVRAVAASEDGTRIFIGGTFTEVNGVPRQNLAAIDAVTGALITDWQADTTGTIPTVKSFAVDGNKLYVGGKFTGIDGTNKQKLAVLDVGTGDLLPWNTWVNGNVNEVRVSPDGGTVWIGGSFNKVRGITRYYFAGVDAVTGQPTAFNRDGFGGYVITVGVSEDGSTVYASSENNIVFAYHPDVSSTEIWQRKMSGNTHAIAISPTEIYIGGHFAGFNQPNISRPFLASIDPATGLATTWDPEATGLKSGTWSLVIHGNNLYAGGQFTRFHGVQQRLFAQFAGTPTP
jgi:hypothetical protein